MKLRSYPIALVVVAVLPVVIFSSVMIYMAYQDQRDDAERGNVLGQPLACFIPQRLRARHHHHFEAFAATGVTPRTMGALGQISRVPVNGEEFPIEASISQIGEGAQKLFTVILRDITERRQTESALRASEARHRTILRTAMDGFWRVDLIPARRSDQ
ncbi:MAG: PAS domain-containing protein [Deltaproteobacteria bacterium]|nr:PAS domain-containing protein [Deltaproteobacteria bacterium]